MTVKYRPWPLKINDHRVYIEEDLEEGVLFFYCGNCSAGTGLPVGDVLDTRPADREKIKKYGIAVFMKRDCEEDIDIGEDININIEKAAAQDITIQVDGGPDTVTRKSIADSIRQRKYGQRNTEANRNRLW